MTLQPLVIPLQIVQIQSPILPIQGEIVLLIVDEPIGYLHIADRYPFDRGLVDHPMFEQFPLLDLQVDDPILLDEP